jgi:hypothetical protein
MIVATGLAFACAALDSRLAEVAVGEEHQMCPELSSRLSRLRTY